jgi:hypothetical protein
MIGSKVAVTARADVIETRQVSVPAQPSPDHPANVDPAGAVAVSVTAVPSSKRALHVAPQSMPDGDDVTVPVPPPALVTASWGRSVKLAVTVRAALRVTVHEGADPQPSACQPENADVGSASALSVTEAPRSNCAEQVAPQAIPAGVEVTVPVPLPARTMASDSRAGPDPSPHAIADNAIAMNGMRYFTEFIPRTL